MLLIVLVGHSNVYLIAVDKLYALEYGVRIIPVVKELCLIKGTYYLYGTELVDTKRRLLLAYVSLEEGKELNYVNALVLTGYDLIIEKDP